MIVAGEASGDRHGASLARALARLSPGIDLELFGSGGEDMRAAGVETLVDARDVAIIGIPEIVRALGTLYSAYRKLLVAARTRRPNVVVLIDWPDFNIRLARTLHRERFKIVYYISPQVWAWRGYRVRALRRDVDKMLVILPFEEEFYRNSGVDVEYVGHPLAEMVSASASRQAFAARIGLDPGRPIIALLPGSRHKEVQYHLPPMLDAANRLQNLKLGISDCGLRVNDSPPQSPIRNPQFVVPVASTIFRAQVDAIVSKTKRISTLDLAIIEGDAYDALSHSKIAVVASGTATVEAALLGTPMVIVYRGSELNWRLIRPLINLDTFGMVNLVAGRRVVPELMQHDVTGENIAREVARILGDPRRLAQIKADLAVVRERLATSGEPASERAARAVLLAAVQTGPGDPGREIPARVCD
jgi:lipid-A-disaccharide synthase